MAAASIFVALVTGLVSSLGVLVSLRAATVRQAESRCSNSHSPNHNLITSDIMSPAHL